MESIILISYANKGTARGIVINIGDNTVMGRIARLAFGLETGDTLAIQSLGKSNISSTSLLEWPSSWVCRSSSSL